MGPFFAETQSLEARQFRAQNQTQLWYLPGSYKPKNTVSWAEVKFAQDSLIPEGFLQISARLFGSAPSSPRAGTELPVAPGPSPEAFP